MWPFRKPLEPKEEHRCLNVPSECDVLKRRLEKTEEGLKKLHEATYGDKCEYHENMIMKYNGETNEFTFGYGFYSHETLLPPVSQEVAMKLAEFILDNYKGGNK